MIPAADGGRPPTCPNEVVNLTGQVKGSAEIGRDGSRSVR
jgi:hypothetical protein